MHWNGNEWVGNAPPPATKPASRAKRIAAAALEASLITALTFGLIAGSAFAAKGGGGGHRGSGSTTGGGTITLAPIVVDNNGNGTANYLDVVTFNISTTATTTPWVNLECSQNGSVVLVGWKGYWAGSLDTNWNFGLASGAWPGGAADCVGYLKMDTSHGYSTLASTSFHVDG
jgi:hypothetical protein